MSKDIILAAFVLMLPFITLFLLIMIYGASNDVDKKTIEFLKKSL